MRQIQHTLGPGVKDFRSVEGKVLAGLALLLVIGQLLGPSALAQSLPPNLRETLSAQLKATAHQLAQVEAGEVVAFPVETGTSDELMLVGISRVWATPVAFVDLYRDITKFETSKSFAASGKFSLEPKISDLSGVTFSREEIEDLKICKVGACAFKIGDSGVEFLRASVNWNAPDYPEQATRALRLLMLEYVLRYQKSGDEGLVGYHDSTDYAKVEDRLNSLLSKAGVLSNYAPRMIDYLQKYPASKNTSTEDFFYWQVADFGMKPVHRITHIAIQKSPSTFGDAYVIASKMLFASHYFRSGIELRILIPGQDQHVGGMHYLVVIQRSNVDGMKGFKGRLLRTIAIRRGRSALERVIADAKGKVEADFNRR